MGEGALRFLIAALLVGMSAISAHAKTVLACLDENVTGFHYKRNKYEPTVLSIRNFWLPSMATV